MPALVIFRLPSHPGPGYDDWDVVEVLPAQQHPGLAVVTEPWRYGFIYVEDKAARFVAARLLPPLEEDLAEDGADAGDFKRIARRRRKILPAFLPAESAFRRYRRFTAPLVVKMAWATLRDEMHDKRADHPHLLPGGRGDTVLD